MRTQIIDSGSPNSTLNDARVFHPIVRRDHSSTDSLFLEETLVIDERACRSPAQAVEDKLSQMLDTSCIGVSQLRLKDLLTVRLK
jgi:hypothetical protein